MRTGIVGHDALTLPRVEASAPAKINLALAVQARRPDGFHDITSLALGVQLFDELSIEGRNEGGVTLDCDEASLPSGRGNLVVRAAESIAARAATSLGLHITLRKRIPSAAGLGGGSSDAAATLAAINTGWGLDISAAAMAELGAELGSDVPLFFSLPAAVIRGRGERVTRTPMAWQGWVVLAFGAWEVSTRTVYEAWGPDDHRAGSEAVIPALVQARRAAELAPLVFNELGPAILRTTPGVGDYLERLRSLAGREWCLTGAGATAFALFDEEEEARRVGAVIRSESVGRGVAVVPTVIGSLEDFLRSDHRWRSQKPG